MIRTCALLLSFLFATSVALAHGGGYVGPPVVRGPNIGGKPPIPNKPWDYGPGQRTGPDLAPGTPATPSTPSQGKPGTPMVLPTPTQPTTGTAVTAGSTTPDGSTWDVWWHFNRAAFLDLRRKLAVGGVVTEGGGLTDGLEASLAVASRHPDEELILRVLRPALLRSLATDQSRDILSADLIALARLGPLAGSRQQIQACLARADQEVAETAALALGLLQDRRAFPVLEALALDNAEGRKLAGAPAGVPARTRVFAVYGLGYLGRGDSQQAIRELIASRLAGLIEEDDAAYADLGVAAMISLGLIELERPAPIVERLRAFLRDRRSDRLAKAHAPNTIARLLRGARRLGPAAPGEGSEADPVADLTAEVAADLRKLLAKRSTSLELRCAVVQALGLLTPADAPWAGEVVEQLIAHADSSSDRFSRNFTAIALAEIAATADGPVQLEVLEFLLGKVRSGGTHYRPWAAIGLGVYAHRRQAAGHPVPSVLAVVVSDRLSQPGPPLERSAYVTALGLMRAWGERQAVHAAFTDATDVDFRGHAAVALGLLQATDHREELRELLRESRRLPALQERVAIGLGLMGDAEAVPILLGLIAPEDGRPPLAVLGSSAAALGFIGDRRSVEPLIAILDGRDRHLRIARAFAAVTLGRVADRAPLPWVASISEGINYIATVGTLFDPVHGNGILDLS